MLQLPLRITVLLVLVCTSCGSARVESNGYTEVSGWTGASVPLPSAGDLYFAESGGDDVQGTVNGNEVEFHLSPGYYDLWRGTAASGPCDSGPRFDVTDGYHTDLGSGPGVSFASGCSSDINK